MAVCNIKVCGANVIIIEVFIVLCVCFVFFFTMILTLLCGNKNISRRVVFAQNLSAYVTVVR